ncbi:Mitochodrial transcription termination factor-related protein [Corchorus olitorius]|uniref:Mitochodrial transcription termination factor-related protein n=1 Tax=Corchorus olitorius TaxID=93759 RepID=A0A1R3J1L4_9ROSI|nr:Mitochodrial transcription termination factor-related protein [Corchorus olitorius]
MSRNISSKDASKLVVAAPKMPFFAKKLPGVRELFEKPPELRKRRSIYNIYKRINASYYGYRDGEDGVLEKVEGSAEANLREEEADKEWRRKGTKEVVTVGAAVAREVLFEEEKKEGICCSCEKEIERMIVKKMMELLRNATDEHSFTISYLINSCGLSPQSALALSNKITKLVTKNPTLLLCKPEKTLLPKFQFFYSVGLSGSDLAKILSSSPHVLHNSLDSRIIPSFNFLKDFIRCGDDKVLVAFKRFPDVLRKDFQSQAAANIAILRECGVPESKIASHLVNRPRTFYTGHEKFKRTVEQVKKLGLNPLKYVFLTAVHVLAQISKSTQERKCNVFKDWGRSDEEIVSAFGRFPNCIQYSEHKIKATMDFFVNIMGLKSSYIANNPQFLAYSLKKRIIPRFAVFQSLLSKGLIKKEISIGTLLSLTENKFLQMFVIRYEDPHLLKLHEEKLGISK